MQSSAGSHAFLAVGNSQNAFTKSAELPGCCGCKDGEGYHTEEISMTEWLRMHSEHGGSEAKAQKLCLLPAPELTAVFAEESWHWLLEVRGWLGQALSASSRKSWAVPSLKQGRD